MNIHEIDAKVTFNMHFCNLWLRKMQELQQRLLACMHIGSGAPARATEISAYRVRNTKKGPRNVYAHQGRVLIISRYSKTDEISGKGFPIPIFLDPETSRVFSALHNAE